MTNNIKEVKLTEKSRTYTFPHQDKVKLEDIVELTVSDSGNHRIKTKDQKLHIVPTGWIHIEIEEKEWTV